MAIRNICCMGAGYVGGPTSAVIANKCPDIQVTVVDVNQERITAWQSDTLPIQEPSLYETTLLPRDGVPGHRPPNLFFSTDTRSALSAANLVFLCVQTPTRTTGVGAGSAIDLEYLDAAVTQIARFATSHTIVVEKSTVPCHTADRIRALLSQHTQAGVHFEVLSNPEFLAQGSIITNLLHPDRVLIGSTQDESGFAAASLLEEVYARWVPRAKILKVNVWSSELAKLAANCFLAQRVSSINTISALCERTGADIGEVSRAIGLDSRIGPHMLRASVGFGGSCLKKDTLSLVYLAESLGLPQVAAYWKAVVEVNEWQKSRLVGRLRGYFPEGIRGTRVAVFGFTFKSGTDDTRESPAISVVSALLQEGAHVLLYDPVARRERIYDELFRVGHESLESDPSFCVVRTPYEASLNAQALMILTGWDEFRSNPSETKCPQQRTERVRVDWHRIYRSMDSPRVLVDGCSVTEPALDKLGFKLVRVGHRDQTRRASKL